MKEGVESLGQVRTQALVLLAIAFLAGAFVGGTLDRVLARPARTAPIGRGPGRGGLPPNRTPRPPGALPFIYDSLGLTAEQTTKIQGILSSRTGRVNAAVETACEIIRPARDSSQKEADAVLTVSQRAKRDSIVASFASRAGGRGPGGSSFGRGGSFNCGPSRAAGGR